MMRLRYIGTIEKTLVDVAALSNGVIITVDDALGSKLLTYFSDEYVVVADESLAQEQPQSSNQTPSNDSTKTQTSTQQDETSTQTAEAVVDPASQL